MDIGTEMKLMYALQRRRLAFDLVGAHVLERPYGVGQPALQSHDA